MSTHYYLWIEQKADGPHTKEAIQKLLRESRITLKTLFCVKGMDRWTPLEEAPALLEQTDLRMSKPMERMAEKPKTIYESTAPTLTASEIVGLRNLAGRLQITGVLFLIGAAAGLLWALVRVLDEGTSQAPLTVAGGLFSGSLGLFFFAQLLHIRAAVEQSAARSVE